MGLGTGDGFEEAARIGEEVFELYGKVTLMLEEFLVFEKEVEVAFEFEASEFEEFVVRMALSLDFEFENFGMSEAFEMRLELFELFVVFEVPE